MLLKNTSKSTIVYTGIPAFIPDKVIEVNCPLADEILKNLNIVEVKTVTKKESKKTEVKECKDCK